MVGELTAAQIRKQIRRRALAFLVRATGHPDAELPEGVPDFIHTVGGLTAAHAPNGGTVAWGSDDPAALALMRDALGAAYAKQRQREQHGRAHTILPLPYDALRALVLAYVDLCQHATPATPWPRHVDKLALDAARLACTYPGEEQRTAAVHRALVNTTRQQREHARAIALKAWFPTVHNGKKQR